MDLSRRPGGGDPSSGELLDDAVEAAARVMALVDEENGCFERVDEFDAITDPLEAEDYIRAHGYPHGDREDCEYWRRRAKAAFEVIAARVRAEAVAEHRAEQRHWIEVGQQLEAEKRVAEAERDEYRRNWQEAEKRTAKAVAEAVADGRQRITEAVRAEMLAANTRYHGTTEAALGYVGGLDKALATAAGSVPVATPELEAVSQAVPMRIGPKEMARLRACLTRPDRDDLTPWEVVECAADQMAAAGTVATPPAESTAEQLLRDIFTDPGSVANPTEPAAESWGDLAADVIGLVDRTLDGEAPVPAEQPAEPIDLLTALRRRIDRARGVDQDGQR